eukprot:PhF_6_TR15918/c4_g1_i1/m.24617
MTSGCARYTTPAACQSDPICSFSDATKSCSKTSCSTLYKSDPASCGDDASCVFVGGTCKDKPCQLPQGDCSKSPECEFLTKQDDATNAAFSMTSGPVNVIRNLPTTPIVDNNERLVRATGATVYIQTGFQTGDTLQVVPKEG